ncbi:MAG: DUF4258 domain-containing protein [Nitrospirae bacterium]|nr:DUF4258 domain-containing protein [Nitrospirota bacterium]
MAEFYFKIKTPLNVEIRTTKEYWQYLITKKHKIMENKEALVRETLNQPDEVRQSKINKDVFLYYRRFDKLYCIVVKHTGQEGFLITAYPVDKVKEGEVVWTR